MLPPATAGLRPVREALHWGASASCHTLAASLVSAPESRYSSQWRFTGASGRCTGVCLERWADHGLRLANKRVMSRCCCGWRLFRSWS